MSEKTGREPELPNQRGMIDIECDHWKLGVSDPLVVKIGEGKFVFLCDDCRKMVEADVLKGIAHSVFLQEARTNSRWRAIDSRYLDSRPPDVGTVCPLCGAEVMVSHHPAEVSTCMACLHGHCELNVAGKSHT